MAVLYGGDVGADVNRLHHRREEEVDGSGLKEGVEDDVGEEEVVDVSEFLAERRRGFGMVGDGLKHSSGGGDL